MQEPEGTIQAGRRYVLGHGVDFYGIWDREVPGKPVETFELTDPGLLEARKRIAYLSRQDFWARIGPKALRWALFGGLGIWIVAGLILWIRFSSLSPFPDVWRGPGPEGFIGTFAWPIHEPAWVRVAEVAEDVAFRLWVGALAVIVALRLLDRGRQPA